MLHPGRKNPTLEEVEIGEPTAPSGSGSQAEGERLEVQTGERLVQAAEPLVAESLGCGSQWLGGESSKTCNSKAREGYLLAVVLVCTCISLYKRQQCNSKV